MHHLPGALGLLRAPGYKITSLSPPAMVNLLHLTFLVSAAFRTTIRRVKNQNAQPARLRSPTISCAIPQLLVSPLLFHLQNCFLLQLHLLTLQILTTVLTIRISQQRLGSWLSFEMKLNWIDSIVDSLTVTHLCKRTSTCSGRLLNRLNCDFWIFRISS